MQGQKNALEHCLDDIYEAQTLDEIWALLLRIFGERGFTAIAYLLFDKGGSGTSVMLLEQGFPPSVVDRFAELGYGRNAPLLRIAMASGRPHLASQVGLDHRVSRDEQQHRDAMFEAGLNEVLALPLYGPLGQEAIVFLSEPEDPAAYAEDHWAALHMIGQIAHLRSFVVLGQEAIGGQSYDLSMRELEILRWVAQGKSNSVISDILGISGGTVDTYLRRLFDKLDVADRTSAAVKGVSSGLIRA